MEEGGGGLFRVVLKWGFDPGGGGFMWGLFPFTSYATSIEIILDSKTIKINGRVFVGGGMSLSVRTFLCYQILHVFKKCLI